MSDLHAQREIRLRTRIDALSDRLALAEGVIEALSQQLASEQLELSSVRARCRYLRGRVRVLTAAREHWRTLAYSHEERLARCREKRS